MFLQFFYLYQLSAENDVGGVSFSNQSIILIIISLLSVTLFFQLIASLFSNKRGAILVAMISSLVIYNLLIAYQFKAQELIQWSFIITNISQSFSIEALDTIFHSLDTGALWYIPIIILICLPFEWFKKNISNMGKSTKKNIFLNRFIIYCFLILIPIDSYDPIISFFRSGIYHHFSSIQLEKRVTSNDFVMDRISNDFLSGTLSKNREKTPPIFLIVCESLNADYIDRFENNKPVTPFLNQLKKTTIYAPIFYGNSIQTAKGHFATYFSTTPCLTGKTFVNYKQLKIKSIASILREVGYHTIYFNAHNNHNFDNVSSFVTHRGYDHFLTVKPFLKREDQQYQLRWGVEDKVFFKRFFDYYDTVYKVKNTSKPLFVTLATIANHFSFNSLPKNRRLIYPETKKWTEGLRQNYANSLRLTDQGIETFFQELKKRPELKNSIVIITGDHAFPLGKHGNYNLESGYHEDSFRIPLFIAWPGVLKTKTLKKAASQLDIGPTIIDLLAIKGKKTNFQGQSIFKDNNPYIPLIQPYGKHLSVVHYPLKYRYNTRLKKEYLYNLEQDPMEENNIFSKSSDQIKTQFRKQLLKIYQTNQAIIQNAIIK